MSRRGGPRTSIRPRRCAGNDARGQSPMDPSRNSDRRCEAPKGGAMMMRMRLGPFVSLTIAFASACSSRDLRIVAGTNDSLVVNNRLSVPLPVYGVDARGRRHTITGLRYQRIGGDSISLTADGRVTCTRRADTRVTVSHERLT